MMIATSIKINAPLTAVWDVFTDIRNWHEWNPVCRECRLEEGDAMARGTCFSFELNPMILSIRIKAVIEQFEPGKKVIWSGSRLGIHASHTFTFNEKKDHVIIKSEESFSGPLLFLARLIGITARLHRLSDRLLESIKQQAESKR